MHVYFTKGCSMTQIFLRYNVRDRTHTVAYAALIIIPRVLINYYHAQTISVPSVTMLQDH